MDQNLVKILCIKLKLAVNFPPPATDRLPVAKEKLTALLSSCSRISNRNRKKPAVGLKRHTEITYINFPQ